MNLQDHSGPYFLILNFEGETTPFIDRCCKVPTGEVEVADTREPKVSPIGLGGPWVRVDSFDEV